MAEGMPGKGMKDWKQLHLWQIQPLRDVLVLAAIFGVLWLGYRLSVVTVPLLLALTLAYLVEPLVARVTRSGRIGRPVVAVALIVLSVLVVVVPVGLGAGFGLMQGVRAGQTLAQNIDALQVSVRKPEDESLRMVLPAESWRPLRDAIVRQRAAVEAEQERRKLEAAGREAPADGNARPTLEGDGAVEQEPPPPSAVTALLVDGFELLEATVDWVRENAALVSRRAIEAGGGALGGAIGVGVSIFGSLGALLFGAFLTAFFFYFMCTGYAKVVTFVRGLLPEGKRDRVVELVGKMDVVIAAFVRGRLTIAFLMTIYFALAYWLIGVPAWLIVGPLVGALTLVPYAAGLGIPVAMLLMWLDPSGAGVRGEWWWIVLAPLVVHGLQQLLDDYVLTPRIQGKATNMDMPTILFASIAGGVLAGFYGLLLAIPVAACIKILLTEVFWPRFRAWSRGEVDDPLPWGKD
jgi:predicted PurR-regulated permease PerM